MGKVVFDTSMSLDGFMTGANVRPEEALGDGGERLHRWVFEDQRGSELLAGWAASAGAVICGRRTYDLSLPWWGADGPTASARLPVFVVSHGVDDNAPEGGVYTFVDGIERALELAQQAADDKDVSVMGGASIGQQFIRAGLVDEISIHLAPVLFGGGTRMFEYLGDEHVELETAEVIETMEATHLRFRVRGRPA